MSPEARFPFRVRCMGGVAAVLLVIHGIILRIALGHRNLDLPVALVKDPALISVFIILW